MVMRTGTDLNRLPTGGLKRLAATVWMMKHGSDRKTDEYEEAAEEVQRLTANPPAEALALARDILRGMRRSSTVLLDPNMHEDVLADLCLVHLAMEARRPGGGR